MAHLKFDISKLEKLNDPGRFETLQPDRIWDAFALEDPEVIVEIGAGTGMFAAQFAHRVPGMTVYVADTERTMIEWMTRHRPEVGDGRLVTVLSDERSVPLDDGVADGVFMINLHHELADPDAIYTEAFRLLRPGGRVLVVDWAVADTPKGPPAAVRVEPEALRDFLQRAGFSQVAIHDVLPWHTVASATRPEAAR